MADAEDIFLSPESMQHPQGMSPNRTAAVLEGEAFGPNYGTMGTIGAPSVLANGVPAATEEGRVTAVLDGQDSGADRQSCVAYGVADRVREPPLDVAPRATGLDGAPHERGEEARVSRYPQESLSNLQQPLQQPHDQPPQSSTAPPQLQVVHEQPAPQQPTAPIPHYQQQPSYTIAPHQQTASAALHTQPMTRQGPCRQARPRVHYLLNLALILYDLRSRL